MRKDHRPIRLIHVPACFVISLIAAASGCDFSASGDAALKPLAPKLAEGMVRLPGDQVASAGIEVHPVARKEFRTHRDFPGTVVPNHHALAEVTALVRGRVTDVHADLGQQVKAGELLALLYSGELGMAQSAYLKAVAKLYVAEQSYERAKMLLEEKVIGLAESQRRRGEMLSIRAEKLEARDRLMLYGMSEKQIRQLDADHSIRSFVPIMAPFDGRVITRNITQGEVVETDQKLFTVANLTDMWVIGNVPEKDVQFIRKDQKVNVVVAAYPHAIVSGIITYVGDVLDPATRTMSLRVTVSNPDRLLKPEMFTIVSVFAASGPDALSIPLAALQDGPTDKMVFVQREVGIFEARTVKVGTEEGDVIRVLDGVKAGERVVTKGSFALKSEMERHKIEPSL